MELESEPKSLLHLYYIETNETKGYNISFIAVTTGGNNSKVMYAFYLKTNYQGFELKQFGESNMFYREYSSNSYTVKVVAINNINNVSNSKYFIVRKLKCDLPTHSLIGKTYREEVKSEPFKVEVKVNACDRYRNLHNWSVFKYENFSNQCSAGKEVSLPRDIVTTTPSITMQALILEYGLYCFRMVSEYKNTGFNTATEVRVQIMPSSLQAIIAGGTIRSLPVFEVSINDC